MGALLLPYKPDSVFEFGCCAGKNLKYLRSILPDAELAGIDINMGAILYARETGVDAVLGDDRVLGLIGDDRFNVSFTISVLDHLPYPVDALKHLVRISRKAVILCEPWLGKEGKVVRNVTPTGTVTDTTPYSYSWDYKRLLEDLGLPFSLSEVDMYSNLGRYYMFYVITP
ncbi:methyltransferase domain-containing protein [Rhodobacteraceae bacterium CCMM004]|nr:methyltransferase domain-containing protein [Rhodobacteraceae bacterium CCMM004]